MRRGVDVLELRAGGGSWYPGRGGGGASTALDAAEAALLRAFTTARRALGLDRLGGALAANAARNDALQLASARVRLAEVEARAARARGGGGGADAGADADEASAQLRRAVRALQPMAETAAGEMAADVSESGERARAEREREREDEGDEGRRGRRERRRARRRRGDSTARSRGGAGASRRVVGVVRSSRARDPRAEASRREYFFFFF